MQRLTVVMLAAALTGTSTSGAEQAPLAPVSKWQMDYTPGDCRLLRTFGDKATRTTIQFSQSGPGLLHVRVVARNLPRVRGRQPASFVLAGAPVIDTAGRINPAEPGRPAILELGSAEQISAAMAQVAAGGLPIRLNIQFGHKWSTAIDLGSLKAPLAAINACSDDLVQSWGLDPAAQRARSSVPVPVTGASEWLRPEDYPFRAIRADATGVVIARLLVGSDGAPTACAVLNGGGDRQFEALTCNLLMARAHFVPAHDAQGKPIASYWIRRISWMTDPEQYPPI